MKLIRILGTVITVLLGLVVIFLVGAMLVYSPQYVYRTLAWQESDAFDWQKFPSHPLEAGPTAYSFELTPDPRVTAHFWERSGADDWDRFL